MNSFTKSIGLMAIAAMQLPTTAIAENPTAYDVYATFNIEQGDAGLCVASPDNDNFVLIQFKSGSNIMRPHSRVSNNWASYYDQSFPEGFTLATNKDYTARIAVSDTHKATVYLSAADMEETQMCVIENDQFYFNYGRVGVRQSYDGDTDDHAYFDDFRVVADGQTLYSEDFSDGDNCTFSLGDNSSIKDGRLYVDGAHSEVFVWSTMELKDDVDFTVEADFEIEKVAAGIIWNGEDTNNYYMWQFNVEKSPTKFRPHRWENGGAACLTETDVELTVGKTYHMLIEVCNGGAKAKTYLDGTLIDTRSGCFTANAMLGIRAAQGETGDRPFESGYYDNFKVVSYADNAEGTVLFSEDFEGSTFCFDGGTVENGRLHVAPDSELYVWQCDPRTTGIDALAADSSTAGFAVYNLQGMRVAANAESVGNLPAGLYIVNGKKVLVR